VIRTRQLEMLALEISAANQVTSANSTTPITR
jgi:hypothetical protein